MPRNEQVKYVCTVRCLEFCTRRMLVKFNILCARLHTSEVKTFIYIQYTNILILKGMNISVRDGLTILVAFRYSNIIFYNALSAYHLIYNLCDINRTCNEYKKLIRDIITALIVYTCKYKYIFKWKCCWIILKNIVKNAFLTLTEWLYERHTFRQLYN